MKHWVEHEEIDLPSEKFFDEIVSVCKKYGLSISHEDGHGAFEIEPFDENNIDWLRGAHFSERAAQIINTPNNARTGLAPTAAQDGTGEAGASQ